MLRATVSLAAFVALWALPGIGYGDTITWTGEVDDRWSVEGNWDLDRVPASGDDVVHDIGGTIQFNMTTPQTIKSFSAGSSGGLVIQTGTTLTVTQYFTSSGANTYGLTLQEDGTLVVNGSDASGYGLINVDCVMEAATEPETLGLDVAYGVSRGSYDIQANRVVELGDSLFANYWFIRDGAALTVTDAFQDEASVYVELEGGSEFWLQSSPYGERTDLLFQVNDYESALRYGDGSNGIRIGTEDSQQTDVLRLGNLSILEATSNSGTLEVSLFGRYQPFSNFGEAFVRDNWDSRGVDLVMQPAPYMTVWFAEMISWNQQLDCEPFAGTAVIFLDVPCWGTHRDLILPHWTGEGDSDFTTMRDQLDNCKTQLGPPEQGATEAGYFRNISVGDYRRLAVIGCQGGGGPTRSCGSTITAP